MLGDIDRAAFFVGIGAFALAPSLAFAADDKPKFRVKVRLERKRDKRILRQIETVVDEGKTVQVLDGTWNYDRMPRSPRGLLVSITAKSGTKVHLKVDAEYGQAGSEQAGGNNLIIVDSKNEVEDDFDAGQEVAYPWTISGEDCMLYVVVTSVKPS